MSEALGLVSYAVARVGAALSRPDLAGSLACLVVVALAADSVRAGRWRLPSLARSFRTDAAYTAFYFGGLHAFLISGPLYRFLDGLVTRHAAFLRLGLLNGLPGPVRYLVVFAAMDAAFYGSHRALHAHRWLWLFHSVHHSQVELGPLTNFRLHFVDVSFRALVQMPIGLLLGAPTSVWIPSLWITVTLDALAHADLDWGYGPLGSVLISPRFHRRHHSADPREQGRNFGGSLSLWDRAFGTAVDGPRPVAYGCHDPVVPESFFAQLFFPFLRLAAEAGGARSAADRPSAGAQPVLPS